MNRPQAILSLAAAGLLLAGSAGQPRTQRRYVPPAVGGAVEIPEAWRQPNYDGGSCVHASTCTALRFLGRHPLADFWRRTYAHGEHVACLECRNTLLQKLDGAGIPYAFTDRGDAALLEAASRTRRPAVITYYPNHAINFLGYVDRHGTRCARLLDNNRPGRLIHVPQRQFLRAWRRYGGQAVVLLFDPPAPEIRQESDQLSAVSNQHMIADR